MYIPNEFAVEIYESIMEAGEEFGIKNCGYFAMRALRIEKFYAFWGQDLDSYTTPVECGRSFRTKLDHDIDFIGREAHEKQHSEGAKRMLALFVIDSDTHDVDADPWPWGGEPIYRDGVFVGTVTTTSFGFSLKKHVALGFVRNPAEEKGGEDEVVTTKYLKSGHYEIEIAGQRFPTSVKNILQMLMKN
jgi:pyruvate dehydrogenase phosphatase regulatory subunit